MVDADRGLSATEVAEREARGQVNVVPRSNTRTVVADRPLERLHAVQRAARRDARRHPGGRAGPGRAVRVRPDRERRHRHRAGAPREADARSAERAHRAEGARRARRARCRRCPSIAWSWTTSWSWRPGCRWSWTATCSSSDGLELDESLLTGESEPVEKRPATRRCRDRSSPRAPAAWWRRPSGADAYAVEARAGGEAVHADAIGAPRRRRPDPAMGDDRDRADGRAAVREPAAPSRQLAHRRSGAVAGTVAMVPEGLVLLMSLAFAVAVLRLAQAQRAGPGAAGRRGARARRRALHRQDGNAHRGQARGRRGRAARREARAWTTRSRRSRPPTSTRTRRCPRSATGSRRRRPAGRPTASVPFSSARKWSAVSFGEHGSWFVGGADVLIGAGRRGERPRGRRRRRGLPGAGRSLAPTACRRTASSRRRSGPRRS